MFKSLARAQHRLSSTEYLTTAHASSAFSFHKACHICMLPLLISNLIQDASHRDLPTAYSGLLLAPKASTFHTSQRAAAFAPDIQQKGVTAFPDDIRMKGVT